MRCVWNLWILLGRTDRCSGIVPFVRIWLDVVLESVTLQAVKRAAREH